MRFTRGLALRLSVATVVTAVSLCVVGAPTASASLTPNLECTTGANLEVINDIGNHWLWSLNGGGQCADGNTTYQAQVAGTGTSTGLGLCDASGVVTNLSIQVSLTLTNVVTGEITTRLEKFSSPITTFPIATPFIVTGSGNTIGAGNLDTHIFLHCPPGGTPSAFLVWDQI